MWILLLAYYFSIQLLGRYIFPPKSSRLQIGESFWGMNLEGPDDNATRAVCEIQEHFDEYDNSHWEMLPQPQFLFTLSVPIQYSSTDCTWSYTTTYDDNGVGPLLLHKSNYSVILPHRANNYWIPHDFEFLIGCPSSSFLNSRLNGYIKSGGAIVNPFMKVRCDAKKIWNPLNLKLDIKGYGCKRPIKTKVKYNKTCGVRTQVGAEYQVGYEVHEKDTAVRVVPEYTVCFDSASSTPYYTTHMLHWSRMIDFQKRPTDRPTFDIFDVPNAYDVFAVSNQKNFFISKFHTPKYINPGNLKGDKYFAKGHMVPDADKASLTGMRTTYNFINVVPQYQTNNKGNWKTIEENIRQLSKKKKLDLKIYTGTHGGIFVKDPTKTRLIGPVFLGDSKRASQGKLKIPKFIYKVVYDQKNLRAAAVILLNDPLGTRNDFTKLFGVSRLPCKTSVSWITIHLASALDDSKPELVENGLICVVEITSLTPLVPILPPFPRNVRFLI